MQERNNLEIFKRNLERQVKELEEELGLQQRQLTTGLVLILGDFLM